MESEALGGVEGQHTIDKGFELRSIEVLWLTVGVKSPKEVVLISRCSKRYLAEGRD